MNSNSFFSILDGGIKIVGIYDGHGRQGHYVSSAAMGIMLDFIRNRSEIIKSKSILLASEEDILNEIKKAFKYTQKVLRQDFQIRQNKKMAAKKQEEE